MIPRITVKISLRLSFYSWQPGRISDKKTRVFLPRCVLCYALWTNI